MPSFPPALSFTGIRYFAPGTRKFYWVPSIATLSSPTRAEMTAGTDLTGSINAATGWTLATNFLDSSDYGTRVVGKISGKITFADSSLTFWASNNSVDVRALLTQDLAGNIITLQEGDVPGQKMNVFKVTVAAQSFQQDEQNPAYIDIQFGILAAVLNVTVPANP